MADQLTSAARLRAFERRLHDARSAAEAAEERLEARSARKLARIRGQDPQAWLTHLGDRALTSDHRRILKEELSTLLAARTGRKNVRVLWPEVVQFALSWRSVLHLSVLLALGALSMLLPDPPLWLDARIVGSHRLQVNLSKGGSVPVIVSAGQPFQLRPRQGNVYEVRIPLTDGSYGHAVVKVELQ